MNLKRISINILFVFFDWLFSVQKDRQSAASTLQTYWNVFCLVRKKETDRPEIDPLIKSQIHGIWEPHSTSLLANQYQVRQRLALKHGLRTEKKEKPIIRAKAKFEFLKTLFLSVEIVFDHERHRVQLALIMQLAGITGNRPASFLGVC